MTSDCVPLQYAGINIGPVHKKDVMKASTMLEHDPQYVTLSRSTLIGRFLM